MSKGNGRKFKIEHWQWISAILVVFDFLAICGSYFFALLLRFDLHYSSIPENYLTWHKYIIIPYALICILVFVIVHYYRMIWNHFSIRAALKGIFALGIDLVVMVAGSILVGYRMPISYYVFGIFFQAFFTIGIRVAYRFVLFIKDTRRQRKLDAKHVMVIGAGSAGLMILKNITMAQEVNEVVKCFIDDNPNKADRFVSDIPVFGNRTKIFEAVEKYGIKKIYFAIPSATPAEKRELLNICKETGCELRTVKALDELADAANIGESDIREVSIEDLLGREPVSVDLGSIGEMLSGKVVLITGGGGSIGSELARQVASYSPRQLILFDIYENGVYDVQLELKKKNPELNLLVLIGSVRDSRKMLQVFKEYRPDFVYHAAAHKHVPLMEDSPCEAIKNNSLGTYKTAFAAAVYGAEKFVLISTDKAVNPTNIMGASKRICEMIVQTMDRLIRENKADTIPLPFASHEIEKGAIEDIKAGLKNAHTSFLAVRFGNVLGSNGSVVPLFKRQISEGGPVTVTHPDIIRYFMTIPEAVNLVLQTSVYAFGGDICVLDMGEPVKIDDLARNLIRLSGFEPDKDIKIEYTGLRPGEKLFEERLMDEEGLRPTKNKLISVAMPIKFDEYSFFGELEKLSDKLYGNETEVRNEVARIVPTYKVTPNK